MSPEEWRAAVGVRIEERRRELAIRSMRRAADMARISDATWRHLETGRRQVARGVDVAPSPSRETQAAVCRVLAWEADGIERLFRGEEPVVVPPRQATLEELRAAGFTAYERPAPPSATWEQLGQVGQLGERVAALEEQVAKIQASLAATSGQPKLAMAAESGARSMPTPKRRARPSPPAEADHPQNG